MILKPSPPTSRTSTSSRCDALGIDPREHDIRFVEDDWESPTLGAWGLGWEVWLDGMEVTQFTYFQQVGGIDCKPVTVELTYGLERIAMYLQGVDNVYDLAWVDGRHATATCTTRTRSSSRRYNFEEADADMLLPPLRRATRRRRSACSRRGSSCPALRARA